MSNLSILFAYWAIMECNKSVNDTLNSLESDSHEIYSSVKMGADDDDDEQTGKVQFLICARRERKERKNFTKHKRNAILYFTNHLAYMPIALFVRI